jgi:hypothetical protein
LTIEATFRRLKTQKTAKGRQRQNTRPGAGCARSKTRTAGVRHLSAPTNWGEDKLYGHIKPRKTRTRLLEFCRYLHSLYASSYASSTRIAIICDNFSPT